MIEGKDLQFAFLAIMRDKGIAICCLAKGGKKWENFLHQNV